jgi:hypothetical protein
VNQEEANVGSIIVFEFNEKARNHSISPSVTCGMFLAPKSEPSLTYFDIQISKSLTKPPTQQNTTKNLNVKHYRHIQPEWSISTTMQRMSTQIYRTNGTNI